MIDNLLSSLAPHLCYGCGEIGQALCRGCIDDIVFEPFGRCVRCLGPVVAEVQLCGRCQKSSSCVGMWCVNLREGVLRQAVDDYKFEAVRELGASLAELLDRSAPLFAHATVTAVPTARKHIRTLGYDHAALVARRFADRRRLPFSPLLERQTEQAQHRLVRTARLKAAPRLFRPVGDASGEIVLVDDILTTGATLEAAAACLKAAGAEKVYGLIIARQPLD